MPFDSAETWRLTRVCLGKTQAEMGTLVCLSKWEICRIERGLRKPPRAAQALLELRLRESEANRQLGAASERLSHLHQQGRCRDCGILIGEAHTERVSHGGLCSSCATEAARSQ